LLIACQPLEALESVDFTIHAGDVRTNEPIARRHLDSGSRCSGENLSPELRWKGPPAGTKSFAVTAVDRDATGSGGRYHWIVVDIPPRWTGLPRGLEPFFATGGVLQLTNDLGRPGWTGPCAARGATPHRLVFTVYALDVAALPVAADAGLGVMEASLRQHAVAAATLTAIHPGWR
jgi:Raf kinase inhibitor-like YbhB/YbcL family protein